MISLSSSCALANSSRAAGPREQRPNRNTGVQPVGQEHAGTCDPRHDARRIEHEQPDDDADGHERHRERAGDNADWKLAGARPEEKLDVSRANAASYSLQLLELADVAPKDAADTGLDKPITIDATTLEGLTYAIKVGKLAGDNYYVSFTSSGNHKAEDKAAREKTLSQHVLLIPKSKLEDTLKPRAELLEKPAQKK